MYIREERRDYIILDIYNYRYKRGVKRLYYTKYI